MEPGARIRVAWDEPWPDGTSTHGEVERWIENPGCPGDTSPIVKLDSPVTAEGTVDGKRETMTGLYLSLGLRYEGLVTLKCGVTRWRRPRFFIDQPSPAPRTSSSGDA